MKRQKEKSHLKKAKKTSNNKFTTSCDLIIQKRHKMKFAIKI